jgi:dihydrofolate synthase/folylpolyglutamate synthase
LKGLPGVDPKQVFAHVSPAQALAAAQESSDPTDRIVVFGSFLTVGGVIENGLPSLNAPHLNN